MWVGRAVNALYVWFLANAPSQKYTQHQLYSQYQRNPQLSYTVTIRGVDGAEAYTLSGSCYVVGDGWVNIHGGPHPGPAVVTCYDEGVPFRYPVREGMSFTMENTGGSYGWEKPRATIRVAGSSVSYGLSDYVGRGGD